MPASTEVKLTAAMKAVRHVLRRINEDSKIAYLMGHCTESYDLLCTAVATHDGLTKDAVEDNFPPCPEPGKPTEAQQASLASLDPQIVAMCQTLQIAPFVAMEIAQREKRKGDPIPALEIDPVDGLDPRLYSRLELAWVNYTSRARARSHHIH